MNIEQTISLYLDGELTSEQEAEFHHLLSVSPEARELFRDHMKLQTIARDEQTLLMPEDSLRTSLFSRLQAEGFSPSAIPGGIAAGIGSGMNGETDISPATPPLRNTEQVRHRQPSPSIASPAEMRHPVRNHSDEEGKKRRRLIPFLVPMVLLAVAGSILWMDRGNGSFGSGDDAVVAAAEPASQSSPSEEIAAAELPAEKEAETLSDRSVTLRSENSSGVSRSARSAERIAAPQPAARIERSASREIAPSSPEAPARAFRSDQEGGGDVLNPAEGRMNFAYDIPPSDNFGDLAQDDLELDQATVASNVNTDASEEEASLDAYTPDPISMDGGEVIAFNTSSPSQQAVAVSQSDNGLLSERVPEPTFLTSATIESSTERSTFSLVLLNDEGTPITAMYDNRDAILETLGREGIFIGHDGTFAFTPPAQIDSDAMRMLANNSGEGSRTDTDTVTPLMAYEESPEAEVTSSSIKGARKSDVASRDLPLDPVATTSAKRLDSGDDEPVLNDAPFISIEGGLTGGLTASERRISWVIDDPVRETSSLKGEILLKGGLRKGSTLLFGVVGMAPYEERSITYNNAAAAPIPPVSENVVRTEQEIWAGVGSRYVLRISERLATGVEGSLGVGEKRFHASISLPVSFDLSKGFAIEILPNVRYRNAHTPLKPTTGTSSWEQSLQGPANDEELNFGTSIGLILFLY